MCLITYRFPCVLVWGRESFVRHLDSQRVVYSPLFSGFEAMFVVCHFVPDVCCVLDPLWWGSVQMNYQQLINFV